MGMTFEEYLTTRIKFGLITENCVIGSNGIAVYRSPNPMVKMIYPNDFYYVRNGGVHMNEPHSKCILCNDMTDFWEKTRSHKALLWSLRGLGSEYYKLADIIWEDLALTFNLELHKSVISTDDSSVYAHYIRLRVGYNPFCILGH